MKARRRKPMGSWPALGVAIVALMLAPWGAAAQTGGGAPPVYKPPPRGAPGGRVGGASRGTIKVVTAPPTIDLLAPERECGETISPAPTLYYAVSRPVTLPMRLTISVPRQAEPVVETMIPSPPAAGIHAIRLADYRVRLGPGIIYTWSVSIVVNPHAPSRDIVASASLLRVAADPQLDAAAASAPSEGRAAIFAQAGLWYDAVAAAASAVDRERELGALMRQVGLGVPAAATVSE